MQVPVEVIPINNSDENFGDPQDNETLVKVPAEVIPMLVMRSLFKIHLCHEERTNMSEIE